ncbi:MAG TPA: thioesterase family protein [Pseudonocardia sp.]|jgi:acyl-CoA thioester hydrolase|nr:thioesterase family protein [Pseudonocardia sp.]
MRFDVQIPLRWADMDAYRHVNHARTVTLLEEARVELVFRRAAQEEAGGWSDGLFVASLQVDYKRQIAYEGQSVRVSMWVDQVRAASFMLHYEVRTGPSMDDPVAVIARTQMVPFDLAANRPRRLSGAEREFLSRWADDAGQVAAGQDRSAQDDAGRAVSAS